MKICITLDDVLRAKTKQICKMYQKYFNPEINLDNLDLSDLSKLWKELGFDSEEEYKEFLYTDYTFEISAECSVTEKMIDKKLNIWHIDFCDMDTENELILANPYEFNSTIPFTYFFLSKLATRARKIILPLNSTDIWNECDVLVTADAKLLNEKPDGKKSVKIKMPYNKECHSDIEYETLAELLDDNNFIEKVSNNE